MSHRMLISGFAAASLLASAAASSAGTMADGTYRCTIGSMHLGNVLIEGNSYAGPAHDGNYEGTYTYNRTDGGTIDWGGPLGGMSSGGNTIVSTVVTDAGGGQQGFDVTLENERGNFQTVSCAPE